MSDTDIRDLRGLVATVCTTGFVTPQFAEHRSNLRSWNDRNGFLNVEYRTFNAQFPEAGRDAVVKHALKQKYRWILQIDADAAPFPANALERMLKTAYISQPDAHVIGAYCQLKGPPHPPTIDTGTGKWEVIFPKSGLLQVIRTGAHFLFTKTEVFRAFGPPWFRSRRPQWPLHAMAEVDNFARQRLDGRNPFEENPEWGSLFAQAQEDSAERLQGENTKDIAGEDSSFCDAVRALGGSIYVDTDLVVGHVTQKIIKPQDFIDARDKHNKKIAAVCGRLL